MKKGILLAIIMCLLLTGCGKDPLSQQLIDDIAALGEITLEDEKAIIELENTYISMTDKQKNQVDNYIDLYNAKKEIEKLKEEEEARIQAEEEARIQAEEALMSSTPYKEAIMIISDLKSRLYNPDSFQLRLVAHKKIENSIYDYFYIEYGGMNKIGGIVIKDLAAEFKNGELINLVNRDMDNYRDTEKFFDIEEMFTKHDSVYTELDIEKILKYISAE